MFGPLQVFWRLYLLLILCFGRYVELLRVWIVGFGFCLVIVALWFRVGWFGCLGFPTVLTVGFDLCCFDVCEC